MNSKNQALESAVSEFHSIKEKNKKYFDLLTTTNNDLNNMKIELQNVLHEKNDIQAKNTLIEREYNTIREELRKYQEKFNESSDAIEQFKSEVKMLKHELDIAHEKLAMKLKESK